MLKDPTERRNFKRPWPCKKGKEDNASHAPSRAGQSNIHLCKVWPGRAYLM